MPSLVVHLNIFHGDAALRVVGVNLLQALLAELFTVGLIEHPMDTVGQVGSIAWLCQIAVTLVLHHLRDATHAEGHRRHTARHSLHDGVGKIVVERRQHIHVDGVVDVDNLPLTVHIAQRNSRQRQRGRISSA